VKIISKSDAPELISSVFKKYYFILTRVDLYRITNILIMLSEIKLRRTKLLSRPIVARVNISPICNLRCPACMGKAKYVSNHLMSFDEYKHVIDKISRNTLLVILYDEGEPLLNQDIYKIIEYTNKLNISTTVSTNFSFELSDNNIERLLLSGLSKIRVSMDGMNQEIYEKYRVGGDLSIVKNNLERMMIVKKRYNVKTPIIELQFLNFGYNAHQIKDALKYARYIGINQFNSYQANFNNLWTPYNGSLKDRVKMGCSGLWTTIYVSNDGQMFPCHYGEDTGIDAVGSIFNHDLEILWNADYMQRLRKSFHRGNKELTYRQCISCPRTQAFPPMLR